MPRAAKSDEKPSRRRPPALTPDGRLDQLIGLAVDVAEEQLRNRTASSQVIVRFLDMATAKYRLETERIEHENKLIKAKTDQIESEKRQETLYKNAIEAFRSYGSYGGDNIIEDDDH